MARWPHRHRLHHFVSHALAAGGAKPVAADKRAQCASGLPTRVAELHAWLADASQKYHNVRRVKSGEAFRMAEHTAKYRNEVLVCFLRPTVPPQVVDACAAFLPNFITNGYDPILCQLATQQLLNDMLEAWSRSFTHVVVINGKIDDTGATIFGHSAARCGNAHVEFTVYGGRATASPALCDYFLVSAWNWGSGPKFRDPVFGSPFKPDDIASFITTRKADLEKRPYLIYKWSACEVFGNCVIQECMNQALTQVGWGADIVPYPDKTTTWADGIAWNWAHFDREEKAHAEKIVGNYTGQLQAWLDKNQGDKSNANKVKFVSAQIAAIKNCLSGLKRADAVPKK